MKFLNFGSLNLDYTYHVPHIVMPGETITSASLGIFPGGKGLNQSVALARAGAKVYHAGLIGEDGEPLREVCLENEICMSYLRTHNTRTGNAIIQVDENGQNSIILFPGANREMTEEFIDEVLSGFGEGDVILLQNEINMIDVMIDKAKAKGMFVVLNPSPFDQAVMKCNLSNVSMFILNELEGSQMSGCDASEGVLQCLRKDFPEAKIILTLGEKGSLYCDTEQLVSQEIFKTEVVDTTAAGDTFTGFFLVAYFDGRSVEDALKIASMAASLAVSKAGATTSIPLLSEVLEKLCLV